MDLDKFVGVIVLIIIVVLCVAWASFGIVPKIKAMISRTPKFEETILSGICEYKDLDEARVRIIWKREEEDKSLADLIKKVAETCFKHQKDALDAYGIRVTRIISQNCTYINDDFNNVLEDEEGLHIYINSSAGDYPPVLCPGHAYTLVAIRASRKASYFKKEQDTKILR